MATLWLPQETNSTAIWGQWNTATTTSSWTISPNYVWDQWINAGTTTGNGTILWQYQQPVWTQWVEDDATAEERRRRNDELQAQREAQSREWLAAEQQRAADRVVVRERALDLLDGLLSETERADRDERNYVQVLGTDGHLYRLEMHRETVHGNIVRVDEHGCILGRACVAPKMVGDRGALPTPDGWVGQYLGLKFDTREFLSHANWSQFGTCRQQRLAA